MRHNVQEYIIKHMKGNKNSNSCALCSHRYKGRQRGKKKNLNNTITQRLSRSKLFVEFSLPFSMDYNTYKFAGNDIHKSQSKQIKSKYLIISCSLVRYGNILS